MPRAIPTPLRPLRWTLAYLAIAGAWLLLDDVVVEPVAGTEVPEVVSEIVFLLLSAGLVYLLLSWFRQMSRVETAGLERRGRRVRALLENAEEVVTIFDEVGRPVWRSPAFGRILGQAEDVAESRPFGLVHPDDLERTEATFRWSLEHPGVRSDPFEFRIQDASGRWRRCEGTMMNLLADPAVEAVVGNWRDVTLRRESEEAAVRHRERLARAQRLEEIGRLAGGIAHDFNNLLTTVRGYADLLAGMDLPEEGREAVAEIDAAAGRAADLTRQLLAYSRRQRLSPEIVDVNGIVEGMRSMIARTVPERVEVTFDLAPTGTVRVDPGQLEQILLNLVVNARDAMPGGGRLTVSTREIAGDDGGPWVELSVADTGHGIPEEIRGRIFDPFFTTKEPGEGTGLGLSTVQGILDQSGGRVALESETGAGSCFRVHLPRVDGPAEAPAERDPPVSPGVSRGERVLVVEDEPAVRRLVSRTLRSRGYEVLEAPSGNAVLGRMEAIEPAPDLLLSDVVMPGVDGMELAARLRERWPGLGVVLMSGYSRNAEEPDLAHGFLPKPFTPDELERCVRLALGDAPPAERV